MCFKAGIDEMETVKNLMSMTLSVVLADVLEVEIEEVGPEARLVEDLGMTPEQAERIKAGIAEYFDGIEVDFSSVHRLQDLLEIVVLSEFPDYQPACSAEEPVEYRKAA